MLISTSSPPRIAVSSEAGPVSHAPLPGSSAMDSFEPDDVSQVFVIQTLCTGRHSLKNSHGKYLSSDSLGQVTASRLAVGVGEEWVIREGSKGFSFQSSFGKYLSVDLRSGKVRADADDADDTEHFVVICQSAQSTRDSEDKASPSHHPTDSEQLGTATKYSIVLGYV